MLNRPIDPPEETIVGFDWKQGELYGYEEGFVIDGEFVPKDDAERYLEETYGETVAENHFSANS